jgi:hypothetical protein
MFSVVCCYQEQIFSDVSVFKKGDVIFINHFSSLRAGCRF